MSPEETWTPDEESWTPDEDQGFLGRLGENLKGLPYGVLDSLVLTPANTLYNFPEAFKNVIQKNPMGNMGTFGPLVQGAEALTNAYGDAATRNMPEDQKAAGKTQLGESMVGGAIGSLGGPVGAWVGSNAVPWAMDQYRQTTGEAPDTPIGSDMEKGLADLGASGLGQWLLGQGAKTGARQITSRLARGGAGLADVAERLTDPDSLRASALSMNKEDQAIRPPRTYRANPKAENLANSIPSPEETTFTNMSDATQVEGGTDGLITDQTSDLPGAPGAKVPSVVEDAGLPSTEPSPILPTGGKNQPVNTSSNIERGDTPQKKAYWLKQATAEAPEFFNYPRDPSKPEFPQLLQHIDSKAGAYNGLVDDVLTNLPPEANVPIGKALFKDMLQKVNEDIPYGAEKPYRDVLMQEMEKYAAKKLGDPTKVQDFRNLFRRQKTFSGGGSNQLNPQELAKLNGYLDEVSATPMNPSEMRSLKTEYDKLGKWSLGESGEYSMRKDAYRSIANSLRNSLEEVVADYAPERLADYQKGNRKLYLASKFTKMAQDRAEQQMGSGRSFQEAPLVQVPAFDLPVVGPLAKWATGKAAPQMFSPEARLGAADADPFNYGTGGGMAGPVTKGIGNTIGGAGQLGTEALSALNKSPGMKAGIASAEVANQQRIAPESNNPEDKGFYDNYIAPAVKTIGNALVPEANAQELPTDPAMQQPEQLLPRETDRLTSNDMETFLMKASQEPQAPIAIELVNKMRSAFKAGDMDTIEKIHSDMTRLFPDLFESGQGVNGKLFYPDDQKKYMDNLEQLNRMGQVDSIHLAKQRNAFNNPQDSRVLPIKPSTPSSPSSPSSSMPKFHEGTRIYSY